MHQAVLPAPAILIHRILPTGLKVSARAHSNRWFQGEEPGSNGLPSFHTEDVGEASTTGDSANLPLSKFFKDQEWGYNVLTGKDSFIVTYKDAKSLPLNYWPKKIFFFNLDPQFPC